MFGHHFLQQSMDQPDKIANPARDQLNRENECFPVPDAPESLVSRDGFRRPAPACSFSTLRLNLVVTHGIPPEFRGGGHLVKPPAAVGSIPSLSGHSIAYRRCSLLRVRRHRASSPEGSSNNG